MSKIKLIEVENKELIISGKALKIISLYGAWYEDIENPEQFIAALKKNRIKADILTFWQRFPDTTPRYNYYMEWHPISVLPVATYDNWYNTQIKKKTRRAIRKSKNMGVEVRLADFIDNFINGIVDIYNETPVRQGRPFLHYGKNFETVKKENSTYFNISKFIGAFYKDELIGFIKLTFMEHYADPMQILSKIKDRDKAPTNALIAKVVEICADNNVPYFCYGNWDDGGLGDFKRNNGFEKKEIPKYYIALSWKGKFALLLKLHRGLKGFMPNKIIRQLRSLRKKIYSRVT